MDKKGSPGGTHRWLITNFLVLFAVVGWRINEHEARKNPEPGHGVQAPNELHLLIHLPLETPPLPFLPTTKTQGLSQRSLLPCYSSLVGEGGTTLRVHVPSVGKQEEKHRNSRCIRGPRFDGRVLH